MYPNHSRRTHRAGLRMVNVIGTTAEAINIPTRCVISKITVGIDLLLRCKIIHANKQPLKRKTKPYPTIKDNVLAVLSTRVPEMQ